MPFIRVETLIRLKVSDFFDLSLCNSAAVFIAFGMNDASVLPEKHIDRVESVYNAILDRLPKCAICLISHISPLFLQNKRARTKSLAPRWWR